MRFATIPVIILVATLASYGITFPSTTLAPTPSTSPPRTNPPSDRGFKYSEQNDDESDKTTESNFHIFLNKISSIARLANTIKMQSDIMNRSGIDNTVGELLNLGPYNASNLWKLKISGLNKFMDSLKTTIQSIDTTTYVKNGEIYISVCEEVRSKKYSLGEFVFEKEITEVVQGFQKLLSEIKSAKNNVNELKELTASLADYQYFKDEYERDPELEKPMFFISFAMILVRISRITVTSSVQNVFKKNFNLLDNMKDILEPLGSVFDFIETNTLKYPNTPSADLKGFGAISQLLSEINDHSLNGLLKNQTDIEKLMSGLSPIFTTLKTSKLANISFSMNQNTRDVVSNIYSIVKDFNDISSKVGNQDSIFNEYQHCLKTSEFYSSEMLVAMEYELRVFDNLEMLSMLWIDYQKLQTELTNVTSLITFKDPKNILVSYTEISRVHVQLKSILNELQKSLDEFNRIPIYVPDSLVSNIKAILDNKDSTKSLESIDLSNTYLVLNCLEAIGSRSRDVFLASRLVRKLAVYVGSEQFTLLKTYFDGLKNPIKLFKTYKSFGN